MSNYPQTPGFKTGGTSAQVAIAVADDAATLRALCLEVITLRGDMTTDEAAAILGRSVLSVRPRFSELLKMGKIFESGERRKNASGHSAMVWTVNRQARLF